MLFFLILLIYFAVDWFLLNSINKRVIHTQNVTDIVYIVKLWKLFCCFLLFSTFQFFFNEYGVLSYFFFFCKNLFYLFIFLLYNIVLVLPYINMNLPRVYTCSPTWTPLPVPSLWVISVHQPHASSIMPGLCIHFIHDIIHVSMPFSQIILPSPQSPKDCSIRLCLFCCITYRVIVTIFLNSIYMHQYTVLVFFFLACFTLYNRLQFHPPH